MPTKKALKKGKRIKLICNPESGDPKDPTGRIVQVTKLLTDQGFEVDVSVAKPKASAEKIAKKAVKKGFKRIIVMGGDGTIEAVARAVVKTKTRLGILPGGTENNIVRSLGIPDDLESACRLIAEGKQRKIDVGQIKNKDGEKVYFLEVAAVGLLAALFPEGKGIAQGEWKNIGEVLAKFVQYQMPKIKVTLDNDSALEYESLLVTVSNTPIFGQGFLIAPEASLNDGLLDVNLYPNISKTGIAAFFAAISGEGQSDDTKVERYRAKKITITAIPKQLAMADGIMLGKGKVKIKVRKKALRIIAGKQTGLAQDKNIKNEGIPTPVAPAPQPPESRDKDYVNNKEREVKI